MKGTSSGARKRVNAYSELTYILWKNSEAMHLALKDRDNTDEMKIFPGTDSDFVVFICVSSRPFF